MVRSPLMTRRVMVPLRASSGMRSQRWWVTLLKSAAMTASSSKSDARCSSEKLRIDRHPERGDETVGLVRKTDDGEELRILGLRHPLAARGGAVRGDAVGAAVG